MKFAAFKSHMTTTSLIFIFCLFSFYNAFPLTGKYCGENKFTSEIISIEQDGECYIYQVEVSYNGRCSYELSHYNIDPGCGIITDAENSEGWKMELNAKDPKTGLWGLKVDDIQGFGKGELESFTVKFRFCPDESCEEESDCISPKVAYKAGQCVYYDQLEVSCKNPLYAEAKSTNPVCYEGTGGTINLSIEGGTSPYSVIWSNGMQGSSIANLPQGEYIYTVTDSLGEMLIDTVQLSAPDAILITPEILNPTCVGSANGAIDVQTTGGTAPYSYNWNTGDTTASLHSLTAGTYTLTVTDANSCNTSVNYTLTNSSQLVISEYISQPGCGAENLGSIELDISGGEAPYEISWSDGVTSQNRYDLGAGDIRVTVTDAQGCSISKNYTLIIQSDISLSTNVTHTTCNNDPVGAIDLFVSGGTSPYTFEWSNGAITEDLNELTAGKYSVLVTDANGCTASYDVNINQNEIILYARSTGPSCPGASDATVDLNVFFATGNYTVEWSNGATTEDLADISAGDYTVTVTDELGCSATRYVQVSDPSPIVVNYDVLPQGCDENLSYEVQLNPSGGSGMYSYEWEDGSTDQVKIFSTSGTYAITITDDKGCLVTEDILVEGEADSPTCMINDNGTTIPLCGTDGNNLTTSIEGAISYQWSVQSSDASWQISSATNTNQITYLAGNEGSNATFFLEVLLENGCTATCMYTVNTCTIESDPDNPDDGGQDPDNPDDGGTDPDNPDNGGTDPDNPDNGGTDPDNPDDGGSDPDNPDGGDNTDPDNPDNGSGDDDGSDDGNTDPDNPDGNNPDEGDGDDGDDNNDGSDDSSDDNDSGNPDEDKDKSCDDCFYTNDIEIVKNGHYYEYSVRVNHNGNCNYDLSHLVIEIPECAYVKYYSNSMGWKMTKVYNDHKTGLTGIKVDDIPSFGKDDQFDSFVVNFTLKSYDEQCVEILSCYEPEIAYKAGTCVQYEQTNSNCAVQQEANTFCKTYPNPTTDWVKVHFEDNYQDQYVVDVHNYQGNLLSSYTIQPERDKEFGIDLSKYHGTLFFLHVKRADGSNRTFRIVKQ